MSKYVGMVRAKNEKRWIEKCIRSMHFCEAVYVLDDHSTDNTAEICRALGAQVITSPFDEFNEITDKNYLLEHIQLQGHNLADTYVVHIDGDEELEANAHMKLEFAVQVIAPMAVSLRVLYLWNQPNIYRTDGVYGNFFRPSVMRLPPAKVSFASATHNTKGLHCSNVIADYLPYVVKSEIVIWHYGYINAADRIRKYEWYNSIDPHNVFEDEYRHTVIGDVFPDHHVGMHGGPLKLQARTEQ